MSTSTKPAPAAAAAAVPTESAVDYLRLDEELTEDERLVRDSVARLVDQRVLPIIGECFENSRFPKELLPSIAELGLLGSSLEGYGCAGLNAVCYGLICRELERGDSALRSFVSVQSSLCMYPIHAYGSEVQKQKWLPRMAKGEVVACFGLTEAHGGSDPANMKTHAKRSADGWVLNGSKMWITNGYIADLAVVWARTPDGVRGFLVERGTRGFTSEEIKHKFSLRASATGALYFDDVHLPADAMLPAGIGIKAPLSCLSHARFGICWGAIGAAQACIAEALGHVGERELFGRTLNHNQAVQIRLAEMVRQLALGQLLAMQLARLKDRGELTPTAVSLAKWNNCRMALEIARDCRDLLGGAGISSEHVAIRHMLNLESVITYEGTQTIHQLSVGRAITGISAF
ncbi:MAG TPA: acyl-CoA dehydrogenase family protein [Steroidobacteraceae bacterium]|jgi:glutaryl-CoA dehydrogenase|nr:acyl-CoA dehydrogenase family protein [Steroidobacteraceae bacterium]